MLLGRREHLDLILAQAKPIGKLSTPHLAIEPEDDGIDIRRQRRRRNDCAVAAALAPLRPALAAELGSGLRCDVTRIDRLGRRLGEGVERASATGGIGHRSPQCRSLPQGGRQEGIHRGELQPFAPKPYTLALGG